jgi:molybdopterin converting factor small subunit
VLHAVGSDWVVLEKESEQWVTIGDLLTDLASDNKDFRKLIFDPSLGKVNEEVMVVLNSKLLQLSDVTGVKLKDGDTVVLVPVYGGG